MKFLSSCLILFLFIPIAMAKKSGGVRDPFNATTAPAQTEVRPEHTEKTIENSDITPRFATPNCLGERLATAQNLPFKQLTIVGVLQEKSQHKVLFKDPQQNIFIIATGEFIGAEQMKLHQVTAKTVEFVGWTADCSPSKPIIVDF